MRKAHHPPNFAYNEKLKRFICLFAEITETATGITKHTGEKSHKCRFPVIYSYLFGSMLFAVLKGRDTVPGAPALGG